MAGYFLVDVTWHDEELRAPYLARVDETITAFGGEFVARNPELDATEGDWGVDGVFLLLRFPTAARAREWYGSEDYAPLRDLRHRGARTKMLLFEGV